MTDRDRGFVYGGLRSIARHHPDEFAAVFELLKVPRSSLRASDRLFDPDDDRLKVERDRTASYKRGTELPEKR